MFPQFWDYIIGKKNKSCWWGMHLCKSRALFLENVIKRVMKYIWKWGNVVGIMKIEVHINFSLYEF